MALPLAISGAGIRKLGWMALWCAGGVAPPGPDILPTSEIPMARTGVLEAVWGSHAVQACVLWIRQW
jgi:hypothetical protein